jgi:ketosteroid isomerase-like protein
MKILLKSSFLFCLILVAYAANSYAQQWSDEQKDVWAGVEKYWAVEASGDAAGFMSYFDDSYRGWSYQSKVPQSKANVAKWIENDIKNNTTVVYTLTPVTIWVKGDFAYVHYYYAELDKNKETGKNEPSSGNWTDILMKSNGKWVLIGDHGGRTSKPNNQ